MVRFKESIYKYFPIIQIIFVVIWLSNLASTDAYFSIYALIGFVSFYLILRKRVGAEFEKKSSVLFLTVFSFIFSFLVFLSNYPLFTTIGDPAIIGRGTSIMVNLVNSVFTLFGGVCTFYPILEFFFQRFPAEACAERDGSRLKNILVFASIVGINLIHLFLVEYPGNVTEDPFTQISEIIVGQYSNFNTYWHTMIIRFFLILGNWLFADLNASIALICVVQVLVMAFSFTYCLDTMFRYGVPKKFLAITYAIYALIPYNMALSISVWKDVLFAAGTLLTITSLFRILKEIGNSKILNYVIFVLGSLLFLLSRTNGWIIYLITFLFLLILHRKNIKLVAVMGALAVLGWALLNPMLTVLNVGAGDPVESLSVPIQQVSRVVADGCELTEEEEALLSRVVDLEEVPTLYTNWLSDPMKVEVRSKDYEYFLEKIDAYRDLWLRLGAKYPWQYLKAWVDQTKGYWNAGYDYGLYSETVTDNPYGVEKTSGNNPIASMFRLYFGLSRHVIFFEPLHSIGLHIWILLLCCVLNIVRKRNTVLIAVPLLIIVIGLWFGTPVYCCFRYVYPLFVSFPLILSTTLYSNSK